MNDEPGSQPRLALLSDAVKTQPWLARALILALVADLLLSVGLLVIDFRRSAADATALVQLAADAKGRLLLATNALATVEARRVHLEETVSEAQHQLLRTRQDTDALRTTYDTFKAQLTVELENRRSLLQQEDEKLRDRRQSAAQLAETVAAAQKRLAEAQAAHSEVSRELERLKALVASTQEALALSHAEAREVQASFEESMRQWQQQQKELDSARKLAQDLAQQQALLRREIEALDGALQDRRHEREMLEKQIERLQLRGRELDPVETR